MLLMALCLAWACCIHPGQLLRVCVCAYGPGLAGGCDPMGPITPNQTQRETQPAYFSVIVCLCVCACVCVCVFVSKGGLSNKQGLYGDNRCSCSKE